MAGRSDRLVGRSVMLFRQASVGPVLCVEKQLEVGGGLTLAPLESRAWCVIRRRGGVPGRARSGPAESESGAVGCWSEARCVPLVGVWVRPETGCARTAGGVRIAHQVVGASRFDVLLVGDRRRPVAAAGDPCPGTVHTGLASSFLPIRFDSAAPASPILVSLCRNTALFGPGGEPCRLEGCRAEPDVGAGPDPTRHFYDHQMLSGSRGVGGERVLPAYTVRRVAAASCGGGGAATGGVGADG
jgi:hypothetical protein